LRFPGSTYFSRNCSFSVKLMHFVTTSNDSGTRTMVACCFHYKHFTIISFSNYPMK
jgi:hypothetical protein